MDLVVVSCELETVLLQLYGIDNLLMLVSFCGMFVCVCVCICSISGLSLLSLGHV